eukprot:Phypoly_transcript_05254.p1 GENE.Phypoly_transcript_05254~~Phypoly_transcript_05254.p1  ORF type:complete len:421 (+),score=43.81 Phypoly_transcript_05254:692-1954(+)
MFLPDGSVHKGDISNRPQQLDDSTTWYLVDTTEPYLCAAKTVMVSSPYKGHFKYYAKYEGSFIRYMPVWTEEEILLCREVIYPNLPKEGVMVRFLEWGGIPRYVLEKVDLVHQSTLTAALDAANLDTIVRYIGQSDHPDDALHELVHMIVQIDTPNHAENYSVIKIQMASKYVSRKITEYYESRKKQELLEFLNNSTIDPKCAGLRGALFEGYACRQLWRGGKFKVRSLDEPVGAHYYEELKPLDRCYFSEAQDLIGMEANHYALPVSSSFPSIDAVTLDPPHFLQMTVSLDHSVVASEILRLLAVISSASLYFVVPSDIFAEFKRQKYELADKEDPPALKNLKQYVLEIPTTHSNLPAGEKIHHLPSLPNTQLRCGVRTTSNKPCRNFKGQCQIHPPVDNTNKKRKHGPPSPSPPTYQP